MRSNRSCLFQLSRLDKHLQAGPSHEEVLLTGVAFTHDLLHTQADLLNVPRLEEVLVGSRVKALVAETHGKHVR